MANKENTGANQLLGANPVIPKGVFVFDSNSGLVLVGDGTSTFRALLKGAKAAARGSVKVNLKTVNGQSLFGDGNLSITASVTNQTLFIRNFVKC